MNVEQKIISILDRKGIQYKTRGNDIVISCLNPLHQDSNPSFGIDKITGRSYCFSCGYGGPLNKLLEFFGEKPDTNLLFSIKQELILEKIDRINSKNIRLPDITEPYNGIMGNCGKVTMQKLSAFTCAEPELLNRVCFPIYLYGKLKFVEARALDTDMKPRWSRYPEGVSVDFILNLDGNKSIVLVEGFSDYANMYRLGVKNVSPLFGALNFGNKKLQALKDAGIQKVIVFTDNDDAGWASFNKIKAVVKDQLQVRRLVPDTDPGDIVDKETLIDYIDAARLTITDGVII